MATWTIHTAIYQQQYELLAKEIVLIIFIIILVLLFIIITVSSYFSTSKQCLIGTSYPSVCHTFHPNIIIFAVVMTLRITDGDNDAH